VAKLTLSFKGTPLKEFPVDADEMIIGSDPGCDIHIDSLAVNAFHARVRVVAQGITIEDMETKSGISVNGKKVNRTLLKHGDIILVGKHTLTLEDYEALKAALTGEQETSAEQYPSGGEKPVAAETVDAAGTQAHSQEMAEVPADFAVQVSPQPATAHPADPGTAATAEPVIEVATETTTETEPATEETVAAGLEVQEETPAETGPEEQENDTPQQKVSGWLQILSGPAMGRTIKLKHSLTDLGKMGLSAALISKRQDGYHIANLDDVNPLLVNDADIGEDSYLLPDGAIISIGNTRMQFYLQTD
jgi:pSer/pThr/pTyr-binding forkhead associated (FHA) protein